MATLQREVQGPTSPNPFAQAVAENQHRSTAIPSPPCPMLPGDNESACAGVNVDAGEREHSNDAAHRGRHVRDRSHSCHYTVDASLKCQTSVGRHISQRGAAATKRSRRAKCVRSRLGTASRRAEKGDSVAHRGRESSGISGRTVRSEKSRTTR